MLTERGDHIKLRKEQQLPCGNWTHWILCAGRGFGKTLTGSMGVNTLMGSGKFKRAAIIGNTLFDVRHIMMEGISGLLQVNDHLTYFINKRMVMWPNGGVAVGFGGELYNKLRGYEFDLVWIDEFSKITHGDRLLEQIDFCLRLGTHSKVIITTTPKNTLSMKKVLNISNAIITYGSSYANKDNLSPTFIANIQQYEGTAFGDQEIHGHLINDTLLWAKGDITYVFTNPNG